MRAPMTRAQKGRDAFSGLSVPIACAAALGAYWEGGGGAALLCSCGEAREEGRALPADTPREMGAVAPR